MAQENIEEIMGTRVSEDQSSNHHESENLNERQHRYPALRTIVTIYYIFSIIIAVASMIAAVMLVNQNMPGFALLALIGGGIIVLSVIALAESIKVIVDIEYNTRKSIKK
jgi:hypothetical protein